MRIVTLFFSSWFFLLQLNVVLSQAPSDAADPLNVDPLDVDVWSQYTLQSGEYFFGICVDYHFCNQYGEEASALVTAVGDRIESSVLMADDLGYSELSQ